MKAHQIVNMMVKNWRKLWEKLSASSLPLEDAEGNNGQLELFEELQLQSTTASTWYDIVAFVAKLSVLVIFNMIFN